MWGTGASSTQCEGAAPDSDWFAWERAGNAPKSENGNGFATQYAQDFKILASLGLTHHRLSIEWARIEPQKVNEIKTQSNNSRKFSQRRANKQNRVNRL